MVAHRYVHTVTNNLRILPLHACHLPQHAVSHPGVSLLRAMALHAEAAASLRGRAAGKAGCGKAGGEVSGAANVELGRGWYDEANEAEVKAGRVKGGKVSGAANVELGRGWYDEANEAEVKAGRVKGGKVSGAANVELGRGWYDEANEAEVKAGRVKGGKVSGAANVELGRGWYDEANKEKCKAGCVKGGQAGRKCDHEPPQPSTCDYCYTRLKQQKYRAKEKADMDPAALHAKVGW